MCVINHYALVLELLNRFHFKTTNTKSTHFWFKVSICQCFHCWKSWSFVADHMSLKSICSVVVLLREGGRKLWKGFNLLCGGSCTVNTPATSRLGWCQVFLQPQFYKGGGRDPTDAFSQSLYTSQPDAERINFGCFRTTTSRLCPKLEPAILFMERAWCMMAVCVLAQQHLKSQDKRI